jgi:hypothetical protein
MPSYNLLNSFYLRRIFRAKVVANYGFFILSGENDILVVFLLFAMEINYLFAKKTTGPIGYSKLHALPIHAYIRTFG